MNSLLKHLLLLFGSKLNLKVGPVGLPRLIQRILDPLNILHLAKPVLSD